LNDEYLNLLRECSYGDEDAYQYLIAMTNVFILWDDLYDKDAEIKQEQVNEVFTKLNFDLSRNVFFQKHRNALESFVFVAWNINRDSTIIRASRCIICICRIYLHYCI